jgi:hypothetical protein
LGIEGLREMRLVRPEFLIWTLYLFSQSGWGKQAKYFSAETTEHVGLRRRVRHGAS